MVWDSGAETKVTPWSWAACSADREGSGMAYNSLKCGGRLPADRETGNVMLFLLGHIQSERGQKGCVGKIHTTNCHCLDIYHARISRTELHRQMTRGT